VFYKNAHPVAGSDQTPRFSGHTQYAAHHNNGLSHQEHKKSTQ
jgi:hypothetical protein